MTDPVSRIRELCDILNEAGRAYYTGGREIMPNVRYDALYDELLKLEKETGIVLSSSPTQHVGYTETDALPKEEHAQPMLSLDKTKDPAAIASFAGSRRTLLSWKMDGLTVVLTYGGGTLLKGVTRGNGYTGDIITENAKAFLNVPLRIPFEGRLILRGEAVIHYSDFERINADLPEGEAPYKNPRNLCAGAVRQLSSAVTASRNVRFYAFALVEAEGMTFGDSHENELLFLKDNGFTIVPYRIVTEENAEQAIRDFASEAPLNDFPSDGLVALYDSVSYGISLGTTAKFPRNGLAFKWKDETAETVLRDVEWNTSRTGRINPVAVFDPVELEGTTVTRASVHNVSMIREMRLGIGDRILVYKANMIIPQIEEDLTASGNLPIPDRCPVCGGPARVRSESSGQEENGLMLFCDNDACPAKKIRAMTLLVSRDALNFEGLSEKQIEKLTEAGILREEADLFRLAEHRDEICAMDGFGEKSYDNLIRSAEKARHTTLGRLLGGLGIPGVGAATGKLLASHFGQDVHRFLEAGEEELASIPQVGPVMSADIRAWLSEERNRAALDNLLKEVIIEKKEDRAGGPLEGKLFVITGSLRHFAARRDLISFLEERGGRVASSVTSKTGFLINNNAASSSSKNKKAAELGVPVITEEELLGMCGEEIKDADPDSE